MPQGKTPKESVTRMTEVVLPNDTNPLDILLGGRLLYWMDMAAAITAQTHAQMVALTVSIDEISFYRSAEAGDIMHIEAGITRAFTTSMEVFIQVRKRNVKAGEPVKTNEAYFTFVAIDDEKRPCEVPPVIPEKETEKERYEAAEERRRKRGGAS